MIYSTSADPPLGPPRASAKNTEGIIENDWTYSAPQNSFYPNVQYPIYPPHPQQYSRSDFPSLPSTVSLSAPPPAQEEDVQIRMGNVEDASMTAAVNSVQIGENGNAEIPMQTSVNF